MTFAPAEVVALPGAQSPRAHRSGVMPSCGSLWWTIEVVLNGAR
jgi:hypothetical protein